MGLKGKKFSEERKKKISMALKGRLIHPITDDMKKKISYTLRFKQSPEVVKRRKEIMIQNGKLRKPVTQQEREKRRQRMIGHIVTQEIRDKISKKLSGKKLSEKHKRKISKNNSKYWLGKKLPKETRKKMSESGKGKIISEETKKRLSKALKGRIITLSTRKKISEKVGTYLRSKSYRKKIRDSGVYQRTSKRMKNGFAVYMNSLIKNPSKPQVMLYNFLKQTYPNAKLNFPYKTSVGKSYSLDVAMPDLKIDYEYDGSYWHKDSKQKDALRDSLLMNDGWVVVRCNEKDDFFIDNKINQKGRTQP